MRRDFLKGMALVGAVAATGGLRGVRKAFAAPEVTLKLHQFLPAQANVPKYVLDVWADNVEKSSGGRIKVDRYPSMQLGGKP
ncbi:MAG: substrate-binding domain-containing protein, partial [Rhizobiaceae bacterium]